MKAFEIRYTLYILITAFVFTACQKVVILDLNTAEPMIVIEGNVTSQSGPLTVYVSTSGSFYTAEGIEPIGDATVIVKDETGNTDTLGSYTPGIYYSSRISGRANIEYNIEVLHDGMRYTGSETFPEKKTLDSLGYVVNEGIFGDGLNEDGDTTYNIICRFQDPEETMDYYRFKIYLNDTLLQSGFNAYLVSDDELFNGQLYDFEIMGTGAIRGDRVKVEMHSLGYNTFRYYSTLNDALRGGMGSTPYNPISNLSNNALGYFGAYASDSRSMTIE